MYGMRRDYFELEVENVDWVEDDDDPRKPTVRIDFRGPDEEFREQLTGMDETLLEAGETDVAFRLQDPIEDADATGVVGVTNRITGDFILELNEDADDVLKFIRAAREYGQQTGDHDGRYRIEISVDGKDIVTYEKSTFLVYDRDGNLVRRESLIPSGVEL
jgi:hypothetical protein